MTAKPKFLRELNRTILLEWLDHQYLTYRTSKNLYRYAAQVFHL
jgi:hypothetical protein